MARHSPKALMILSCSKRKKCTRKPTPALELYDGPAFRIIRRFLAESNGKLPLDVLILSAKHGFMPVHQKIQSYEMRMSRTRARANSSAHQSQLRRFISGHPYGHVFINLGRDYLEGVASLPSEVAADAKITFATGRIGQRLSQMKKWLVELQSKQGTSSR